MNPFIADHREFVRARRNKNQDAISFARLVHAEPVKSSRRRRQRIAFQFSALNINTNFSRRFRFRLFDRADDTIVFEFAQKFFRAHFTNPRSTRHRQNFRRRR
ncbi:MAG: hypothetical protein QOG48_2204 [Verrucomicrobiota bacterium]